MKHWSVDMRKLKKDPKAYIIWKLEQMINFGLGDGKISKKELIQYWDLLSLYPAKKKFLSLIIAR